MGLIQYFVAFLGSSGLYAPQPTSTPKSVIPPALSSHSHVGHFILAIDTAPLAAPDSNVLSRRQASGGPSLRRRREAAAAAAAQSGLLLSRAPAAVTTNTETPSTFVSSDGTTLDCHDATKFVLVGDQLWAGGEPVTASPRMNPYQPFVGHDASDGPVDGGFSVVVDVTATQVTRPKAKTAATTPQSGRLQWSSDQFSGGDASFCLAADGIVYALFSESSAPVMCTPVTLQSIPFSQCTGKAHHTHGHQHGAADNAEKIDPNFEGGKYEGSRFDGGYGEGRGERYSGGRADGYGRQRVSSDA